MGYKDIYEEYQGQYEKSNRLKFEKFLEIFKRETNMDLSYFATVYQIDITDAANEFYFLKWILFNFSQRYIPYFYRLLEEFGYDMFSEIMDTMNLIGKDTYTSVSSDVVQYSLISPYIDKITVDNHNLGLVTIHSNDLGDFSFYPSRIYLANNERALRKINDYKTARFCHQMSWELMNHFDKCELITSLLPTYFGGTHYHTVLRDDCGLIVDVAMEAVYTDNTREMLFESFDVCLTEKADKDSKLKVAIEAEDEESKKIDFPNAMLLTLHEQSKGLR